MVPGRVAGSVGSSNRRRMTRGHDQPSASAEYRERRNAGEPVRPGPREAGYTCDEADERRRLAAGEIGVEDLQRQAGELATELEEKPPAPMVRGTAGDPPQRRPERECGTDAKNRSDRGAPCGCYATPERTRDGDDG